MSLEIVEGDLLRQSVEVIVNSWNKNFIPWWLLLPQGVSGRIKKEGGFEPFKEVRKKGSFKYSNSLQRTITAAMESHEIRIFLFLCLKATIG